MRWAGCCRRCGAAASSWRGWWIGSAASALDRGLCLAGLAQHLYQTPELAGVGLEPRRRLGPPEPDQLGGDRVDQPAVEVEGLRAGKTGAEVENLLRHLGRLLVV